MYYVLERFEGDYAVLIGDDKTSVNVLKTELISAQIGNVFLSDDNGNYILDKDESEKRRSKAISLHRAVFNKAKK